MDFSEDFIWGVAACAAQVEGAASEDGRGPSIWDTFAKIPGRIADGTTPAVTCDQYHRLDEHIAFMKSLGISIKPTLIHCTVSQRYLGVRWKI